MRPVLIYFRETLLDANNKFTLDFSDHDFVQEIEFLSKNKYYITGLKEYIHEDEKIKKLSAKSRLLLEKGAAYLCDIDYLVLISDCYIKDSNHICKFKLYPKITGNCSYKYEFWNTIEKKIRDGQIYSPYSQLLEKGFNFEREVIKGLNLIVPLNEEQTLIESFFLHRSPRGGTEYLNFFGGKAYYRDINLYFAYDTQYKQWFSSRPELFTEAIFEKVRNKNFILKAFARQYYHVEKKGNGYAVGHLDQKRALGNRGYLMPVILDVKDIWVAPNEIFYTAANAAQMKGKTFLTQNRMKYMGTYTLNANDRKQFHNMLPNFQLKKSHKRMKVKVSTQDYQNELGFYPYNYYGSFGQVGYPAMGFEAVSSVTKKYKE